MQCPYCRGDSSVTETRYTADGLRRRRVCQLCKRRFTTYEKLGAPGLKVAKRDGTVEPFDAQKLRRALHRLSEHDTRITDEQLHHIAYKIEGELVDTTKKTVEWSAIVVLAIRELRALDERAAQRLEVNYADESGTVRFDRGAEEPSQQLGLPLDPET